MSDAKSSNRQAWARSEGIYRKVNNTALECDICGRRLNASALTRAAHGKKHVREGKAVVRTEYGLDGPRTIYEAIVEAPCHCETCEAFKKAAP